MTPRTDPAPDGIRRLVLEANATEAPYRGESGISRLFEEQASQTPDAVAVHVAVVDRHGEREFRVSRSLGYNPLFQVWFVLDNAPVHLPQLDDLMVRPLRVESAAVRHDLHLTVRELTGSMEATLEYSSDLFDRETILHLAGELEVVLYLAVSSPDAPLTRFHEAIDEERARRRSAEQRDMDLEMKKRLEAGRRKAVRI